MLLPDDLIDERDQLLGTMIDVHAEHGGIVHRADRRADASDISKYGCVAPPPTTATQSDDIVTITDLVEKPPADDAPSTLAIIGRYVLPPEIFDALRDTEPGAGGEIQITDAMQQLAHDGVPVHGVVFRGRRYDTGDRLEYIKAFVQLAERHPDIGADFTRLAAGVCGRRRADAGGRRGIVALRTTACGRSTSTWPPCSTASARSTRSS